MRPPIRHPLGVREVDADARRLCRRVPAGCTIFSYGSHRLDDCARRRNGLSQSWYDLVFDSSRNATLLTQRRSSPVFRKVAGEIQLSGMSGGWGYL